MKSFKLDDIHVKYSHKGDGPMVVLLHGFGGHPSDWRKIESSLIEDGFSVLVPNLNTLFAADMALTFSQQVRILSKMISLINKDCKDFHLVGTSYGGALSWGLRLRMKELIASHTLVNPMPLNPIKSLKDSYLSLAYKFSYLPFGLDILFNSKLRFGKFKKLGRFFHMGLSVKMKKGKFGFRKVKLLRDAVRRFVWVAKNENWSEWQVRANDFTPTVLLFSKNDHIFNSDSYEAYAKLINNCEPESTSRGGHLLVRWKPKKAARAIYRAIERAEKGDRREFRRYKIEKGKMALNRSHLKVG